eukprot:755304-Alexandrium_andersonii.AAC.1
MATRRCDARRREPAGVGAAWVVENTCARRVHYAMPVTHPMPLPSSHPFPLVADTGTCPTPCTCPALHRHGTCPTPCPALPGGIKRWHAPLPDG